MNEQVKEKATTEMVTFRLPSSIKARLTEKGKEQHRTLSNMLLHIIAQYLGGDAAKEIDPVVQEEAETFRKALEQSKIEIEIESAVPPEKPEPEVQAPTPADKVIIGWVAEMPSMCLNCGGKSLLNNQVPQTWACNDCFASGPYGEKNRVKEK